MAWKQKLVQAARERQQPVVGSEDTFYRDYTIGDKLGEGAFATVHQIVHNVTNEVFAAKLVDKTKAGQGELQDLMNEVKIMRGLQHQNIISLFGSYEGKEHIIIVMNRVAGGTLFERIVTCKHYTEHIASLTVQRLLEALTYLHQKGIAHRDIKPENLLLRNKPPPEDAQSDEYERQMSDVVIADFGLACKPPGTATCGSPCYVAPEVILVGFGDNFPTYPKKTEYSTKCDVWSLGVVLYVMLSGRFPFAATGRSRINLFNAIVGTNVRFTGSTWDGISEDAKSFISDLLTKDPVRRPTAKEALSHSWITGEDLKSPLHQRSAYLQESVAELKAFSMKRHVLNAMSVYRQAGGLFHYSSLNIPAFRKYIVVNPKAPFSLRIPVQSQSNKEVVYTVDLSKLGRRMIGINSATSIKGHRLQTVCSCSSVRVCRHIQYVFQWLFMGDRDKHISPHLADCEELRLELLDKVAAVSNSTLRSIVPVVGATALLSRMAPSDPMSVVTDGNSKEQASLLGSVAAAGLSGWFMFKTVQKNRKAIETLQQCEDFILASHKLKAALDSTPESERKSVLTGGSKQMAGALAFTQAGEARRKKVQEAEAREKELKAKEKDKDNG
eukprot:TRINITY_DN667_c1_g4_i1.p1 TRINITY_DN667_c1_g4~~TRINITY_DN667_c1_g4_i1.p1  ORF type:complete len:612 (+),score=86.75 TRINITY_DN667_c1_g4_i1:2164-3999(+)